MEALTRRLLPLAAVLTPNLPEAEVLAGIEIRDEAAMARAAEALLGLGAQAVLLKGGHLPGDARRRPAGDRRRGSSASRTRASRPGTPTAPAAPWRARSPPGWRRAWPCATPWRARGAYVRAAIAAAPGYGAGHGPLDHGVTIDPQRLPLSA